MRELSANEVGLLRGSVEELSAYHNAVSTNFSGSYPSRPVGETLALFASALESNTSRVAVIEEGGAVVGFCKIDLHGTDGKLDYLFVDATHRGHGHGGALMDWAMAAFDRAGVRRIEVKVVDGNPAIHLYEKYGFRMNAHLLVREGI